MEKTMEIFFTLYVIIGVTLLCVLNWEAAGSLPLYMKVITTLLVAISGVPVFYIFYKFWYK
jgi:uncharacterized membrane-anchored protein